MCYECLHFPFCVQAHDATNSMTEKMQRYSMADHPENVSIADFDVVRSTQFVDDASRGVRLSSILHLTLHIIVVWRSLIMECLSPSWRLQVHKICRICLSIALQMTPICMYRYVEFHSCSHRGLIKHRYAAFFDNR